MQRVGTWLRGQEARDTLGRRLAEVRALERWAELVGPQLAKRTRVMHLAGDRLVVVASGAALRQELTFHKEMILRKFNEAAGRCVARRIQFLESDAQLSSLLGREEAQAPVGRAATSASGAPDNPERAAEEKPPGPAGPAYEPFDAESYRRELAGRD